VDWLKNAMVAEGNIAREDLDLIQVLDDPEEVVRHIQKFVIL
jgi:predicted Rossmann-fold nucleotide-binding protein